jgi:uncharacterized lipoprotein NlpE involved in copper resistance
MLRHVLAVALVAMTLMGCDRQIDALEMNPITAPFYAVNCYGKSLAEKVKNRCNLTKQEQATLDEARANAGRQEMAAIAQQNAQIDSRFTEQKERAVRGVYQWLDEVLRRLESDPRVRLDRRGPSTAFSLSQSAITEEFEKCTARTSLGVTAVQLVRLS